MPTFAASSRVPCAVPGVNAKPAMNSAIVKPIPPRTATPMSPGHVAPRGSVASPARTASHDKPAIPRGFPTSSPSAVPNVTALPIVALSAEGASATPALANANRGMIPNETMPCSACSMRMSGGWAA